jgi:hypothetical protein
MAASFNPLKIVLQPIVVEGASLMIRAAKSENDYWAAAKLWSAARSVVSTTSR